MLNNKSEIKSKIEAEIENTVNKISEYSELTRPVEPENAIGRISRMDAINNKTVFDASLRNSLKRKNELEHALKMIDEKNYGLCIKCGLSIPIDRLRIRPEVRVCVDCGRV